MNINKQTHITLVNVSRDNGGVSALVDISRSLPDNRITLRVYQIDKISRSSHRRLFHVLSQEEWNRDFDIAAGLTATTRYLWFKLPAVVTVPPYDAPSAPKAILLKRIDANRRIIRVEPRTFFLFATLFPATGMGGDYTWNCTHMETGVGLGGFADSLEAAFDAAIRCAEAWESRCDTEASGGDDDTIAALLQMRDDEPNPGGTASPETYTPGQYREARGIFHDTGEQAEDITARIRAVPLVEFRDGDLYLNGDRLDSAEVTAMEAYYEQFCEHPGSFYIPDAVGASVNASKQLAARGLLDVTELNEDEHFYRLSAAGEDVIAEWVIAERDSAERTIANCPVCKGRGYYEFGGDRFPCMSCCTEC